uniref:Uncharacterized protein n=1 Tax=Leersia perrieri TaxID=77586 RepID=A0A0D9XI52_9ORYZ
MDRVTEEATEEKAVEETTMADQIDRLHSTLVARRDFGPGCFVGEPFFVPDNVNEDSKEDNGYVVCYMHKEDSGESQFVVMDAWSSELDIITEVRLPGRVPYGFHGLFVMQAKLLSQQQ